MVLARANGTGVADAGAMEEANVQAQAVGVGRCLEGIAGTPREVQEVQVHSSKAAADRVR